MNLLNRVSVNLIRSSKKTLIFFGLVFVIGILISSALTIRQAIHNTEARLMSQLPAIASIDFNGMKHTAALLSGATPDYDGEISHISNDLIHEIASLPQVDFLEISREVSLFTEELEIFSFPDGLPEGINYFEWQLFAGSLRSRGAEFEIFNLTAITNTRISYFEKDIFTLSDGRLFTQYELDNNAHSIIISRELADYNNLLIGSIINFKDIFWNQHAREETHHLHPLDPAPFDKRFIYHATPYSLEVIGIFDVLRKFDYEAVEHPWLLAVEEHNLRNTILAPAGLVTTILYEQIQDGVKWAGEETALQSESDLTHQTLFILNNPNQLSSFIEDATALLPHPFLEIQDLSATFGNLTSSMEQLLWIADHILWGTILLSIMMLSFLIILYLKDRKVEIGILMALGEKKSRIALQVLIEVLFVASFALVLATLAGYYLSDSISHHFIQQDLIAQQEQRLSRFQEQMHSELDVPFLLTSFNPGNLSIEEMKALFDTSLSISEIILIYTVTLSVTAISTTAPILFITKISPKKVLM